MFKPLDLDERQCIAHTKKHVQCHGKIGEGYLASATRRISELRSSATENCTLLVAIVRLLICKRHSENCIHHQLEGLMQKYEPELMEYASTHRPSNSVEFRLCQRNSKTTLRMKLESPIKDNQFPTGFLYIYTWDSMPGFVKIGCAKTSSAKRVAQWAKCHPALTLAFHTDFIFPQRIEELVHLQLADKRYEVSCNLPSCKSDYHNEWFTSSVEGARRLLEQWKALAERSPIYDIDTRQLAGFWKKVLQTFVQHDCVETIAEDSLKSTGKMSAALDAVIVDDLERMSL